MIPHRTPFFIPWIYPSLKWRIPTNDKTLYLTFDDGPIPDITEEVLSILRQFNARATFFCIGDNVEKYPAVFNQIIVDGHAIGNHTQHHVSGWKTSAAHYIKEVEQADRVIQRHSGKKSNLFRPPYGRITRNQIRLISHEIVMWDVLSFDYDSSYSTNTCLLGTIKASRPGSIIVFHDSQKAAKNMLFTLPRFLEAFSNQGYSFKALEG